MPKGEQGFPPPGGKKDKRKSDAVDSLVEALAAGTDEAADQRVADEIEHDKTITARVRSQQAREFRELRSARRATESGRIVRMHAEAKQEDALQENVSKNLGAAKEKLARASFSRKADKEYIAARRERIEELRQESVEAMKSPKTGDRKRPRDYMEEISAIEADILSVEERMRARVPSSAARRRPENVSAVEPEEVTEAVPNAPEEQSVPEEDIVEEVVVPDVKTDAVRAGRHATDPLKAPETPKEMQASLVEAARIFQSGEGYIDPDELQRKAREHTMADAGDEAARIFQSGGEGYIDLSSTRSASSEVSATPIQAPEASPKPPRDAYMAEDMNVMFNSVLTKQALGNNKKAIDRFVKKHGPNAFPADPTYAATPEGRTLRTAKNNRYEKEETKKKLTRAGIFGLAAAGLLAFFGLQGKKAESVDTRTAGGSPAAAKSAADAGLTMPSLDQSILTIPSNVLADGIPQSLSQWADSQKAPSAKAENSAASTLPPTQPVSKARAKAASAAPSAMTASAELKQHWDPAFNNWEHEKKGQSQATPNSVKLPKMAGDTGYTITAPVVDYPPAPGAPRSESARPAAEVPSKKLESTKLEVDPSVTHLYSIPDASEPGGEALVVYGGRSAASEGFMAKVRAFAEAHPGRTIYFDSAEPTIVDGKEVRWVAGAIFNDGVFAADTLPTRPDFVGVQLDPAAFTKKIG